MNDPAQPATPAKVHVFQHTTYTDNQGRSVESRTPVGDNGMVELFAAPQFYASITGTIHAPGGEIPVPLRIQLEATNPIEAFAVHNETCERDAPKHMAKVVENMKRERNRASLLGGLNGRG